MARKIRDSMVEQAQGDFDAKEMEHLGHVIRVSVQFHNFFTSRGRWPVFEDPSQNMRYALDSILWNIDSFEDLIRHCYGIMDGRVGSTVDWGTVTAASLKDRYLSLYEQFIAETDFLKRFRLLLDLYKLLIVLAGMSFDIYLK